MQYLAWYFHHFFRSTVEKERRLCLHYVTIVGNVLKHNHMDFNVVISAGHVKILEDTRGLFLDVMQSFPYQRALKTGEAREVLTSFDNLDALYRYNQLCDVPARWHYRSALGFLRCVKSIPDWESALCNLGFKLIRL